MITVPKEPLTGLEDGFLRLWLTVNHVAAHIEIGTDSQILAPVLRQELGYAMQKFYHWRKAKWTPGGKPS
jgi:hypothetical protein